MSMQKVIQNEQGMRNALEEMKFYTIDDSIKILGSYLRNFKR